VFKRLSSDFDTLQDAEKKCLCCGGALHVIRQEISEQLEIIPVQYCVIENVRLIYGCRPCDKVIMSPKPPAPLPKALAGPSLLTDVVLNKYQYPLPLYRQSKIMQSYGVIVSDKTLSNWVMASGEALLKGYEAMWIILKQRYLQGDETPVKGLETNKKGYVWAYFAPNVGKGLVAFEFSLTREGSVANERLKTFKGLLQTDGYKGYDALRKRDDGVGFGCLSHARRKFSEVVKISKDKQGIAAEMIERMNPLYALEARLREANAPHRTRKRLRQKIARPLLNDLHAWLRSIQKSVLPKSKLGKAIFYTLKQWPYRVAYLRHGMAEIDTN
jgi:transposase